MHYVDRLRQRAGLAAALLLVALPAFAGELDWESVADRETIHVLTRDADGDTRETKIWLLVLDGEGYIRTSRSTTWGDNVERDRDIALRIGEVEVPVRAQFIEDADERARIVAGFDAKYGSNWLFDVIRGNDPRIMHVVPR
jgi:hypothetical protein